MIRLSPVPLLVAVLIATPVPAVAQQADRAWLALGDSYSSGEGINRTPAAPSEHLGKDCRRATGEGTDATAWPAGAYREVREELGFGAIDFVACTGNISDDAATQIAEATATGGRTSWDVVTFSFGGNNILFSKVIEGCVKPRPTSWSKVDWGCEATEAQLHRRADMLTGKTPIEQNEFKGEVTLPQLYDQVAEHVTPGGDVLVLGYPNLIEEVDRQSWIPRKAHLCDGIRAGDVPMLRSAGAHLNQRIAEAVADADARHQSRGVRFHFVDIAKNPYELDDNPRNRHARCTGDPWLNGLLLVDSQPGEWHYKDRSFHPHQEGHTNTARVVAEYLRSNVTFDDPGQSSTTPSPEPGGGPTTEAAIARFEKYLHALGEEDIDTVCEIAGPAAKRAEEQGFGPCESTFGITFEMISPDQKAVLATATVDPALVETRSPHEVAVPAAAVRPSGTFTSGDLGDYILSYQDGDWFIVD